jgi:hypothetical protein
MKKIAWILIICSLSVIITSCTRKYDPQDLRMVTFGVASSKATGGDSANGCFMTLSEGWSARHEEAKNFCEWMDFVYSYESSPGNYRRVLETVQHSGLATDFETITSSLIQPVGIKGATDADFDRLTKSYHVESLIKKLKIDWNDARPLVEITNNADDTPDETLFAFVTSRGKKGFMKVASYQRKLAPDDQATLAIYLKVEQ